MAFPTKSTFIHRGDWDAETDSHPATNFLKKFANTFDTGDRAGMFGKLTTDDFFYSKADGNVFPEGQASWDAVLETYQFFSKTHHLPYFAATWERDDGSGWDLSGNAYLLADLVGPPGENKQFSHEGHAYDVNIPAGFYFGFRKVDGGIKLDRMEITSDSGPAIVKLLQRGVIKPADLGL